MKSKTKIVSSLLFLLILVIITTNNLANPVLITYFSELYFDSTGWKLELHKNFYDYETTQLKGCLLTSLNDSAYIKSDLILDSNYVVLTKDDLTKNLTINPLGDKISLYLKRDDEFYYFDELEFGDSLSWPIPPAPKQNYSLCVTNNYNWYLDNSPTIGFPNDTVGACGKLKGIIKDSLGNAISNVRIYYDRNGTELIFSKYILADSLGKFSFDCLSGNRLLFINNCKDGNSSCTTLKTIFQVLMPGQELYLDLTVPVIVKVKKEFNKSENFSLEQNYPNPFNASTKIKYTIPALPTGRQTGQAGSLNTSQGETLVSLKLFDLIGNEVATLVNEEKPPGTYEVEFSIGSSGTTTDLPSGIYFYKLQADNFRKTRKMLLLK